MVLMLPEVSLVLAGVCALLHIWLAVRVGQVRRAEKVFVGDGANDRVVRRVRAHANFAENAWLVLTLVLVIELSLGTSIWLWAAAVLFVVARIGHGVGMDGWMPGRSGGTAITFLLEIALGLWAIAIPLTGHATGGGPATEVVPAQG